MSGRAKHKFRELDRSSSRHKTKSRRRSSSTSDKRAVATVHRNTCGKDKRQKSEKTRGRSSSSSSSSDSCGKRLFPADGSRQLERESLEFCENTASRGRNNGTKGSLLGTCKSNSPSRRQHRPRSRDRASNGQSKEQVAVLEHRILHTDVREKEKSRSHSTKDSTKSKIVSRKSKKSHKRRRSHSSSSSSSNCSRSSSSSSSSNSSSSSSSSSSRSSSSSSSSRFSSSSSSSSDERRKRRKKRKKKLAKKIKQEEKRRKIEKRQIKKAKEKLKETVKDIKQDTMKMEQDRLLKDINTELADRAKAMAPMTKKQWEKKQSIVRRVYDEETGRHRLIKGEGEVLEEIVSRNRHMEINKNATKGDGEFFQSRLGMNK